MAVFLPFSDYLFENFLILQIAQLIVIHGHLSRYQRQQKHLAVDVVLPHSFQGLNLSQLSRENLAPAVIKTVTARRK
jgi:hypothetical protein